MINYPVAMSFQFGLFRPVAIVPLPPDLHQAVTPTRHKPNQSINDIHACISHHHQILEFKTLKKYFYAFIKQKSFLMPPPLSFQGILSSLQLDVFPTRIFLNLDFLPQNFRPLLLTQPPGSGRIRNFIHPCFLPKPGQYVTSSLLRWPGTSWPRCSRWCGRYWSSPPPN